MKKYNVKNIIGFKELRENSEMYIREIENGQSFLVLRRSKPIFKIVPVDEWGDEGNWETLIDFTKIYKRGIPAEKLLKIMKDYHESHPKVPRPSRHKA